MKNTEQNESDDLNFRELFSEDETRAFYQPELLLPTRRIAFWSLGASVLLAGALVASWFNQQNRLLMRPKPTHRFTKNSTQRPTRRSKNDTTLYLRQSFR
ncbi:hypothetical protein [Larkinella rosea]|uniref:Uncharacterized protein n=1 Tax=Larkinella rosea TaxID=2025312 RepID=A0A3P1BJI7_9BACT|nr:hypothetical protein [Larkinella rosea]RRB01066.1 hypothetical protein EHT25_23105 [Larkinella rosea]